eukprot:219219_1
MMNKKNNEMKLLSMSRNIMTFNYAPQMNINEYPLKVRLLVHGYIRNQTPYGFPTFIQLYTLCYFCYGAKDKCEKEKCKNVAKICDDAKCVSFVCENCECSHGKE